MILDAYLEKNLRCPDCLAVALYFDKQSDIIRCSHCSVSFPYAFGRPVLVRHDNQVFSLSDYQRSQVEASSGVNAFISKYLPGKSVNLSRGESLNKFAGSLGGQEQKYVLVVGGGTQKVTLERSFSGYPEIRLVFVDVDITSQVDFYCDAHDLPFADGCFDGVITTAVLEHVLDPARVAAEITRVMKMGGELYSELPFMQQVHEGAYDFTRFSLSGHRRLFCFFEEIDAGLVAGPATALVWSIEAFVLSFISARRSRMVAKALLRPAIFWIKYFDYLLINRKEAIDSASCTFFYGSRCEVSKTDQTIVDAYSGAQSLRHL